MTADIDKYQRKIIELSGDTALILAGPGCGKTHVLARRVFHAAQRGVEFGTMLCVTFTNRAAREMKQRIHAYLGYEPADLFAGNLHRFCLAFLFENKLIPSDTSVLDEEDRQEYLLSVLPPDRHKASDVNDLLTKTAYVYQTENKHPEWTLRNPKDTISDEDYLMIDQYRRFKEENRLIDFDDILLYTLTALLGHRRGTLAMSNYSWIQVDEVQDMTPLQLSIVDHISADGYHTLLYFGDEQQAIFNFIGAGGRALEHLKTMCRGNILRLYQNYRSPRRLVEMCNRFAVGQLHIDPALLPWSNNSDDCADMLTMYRCLPGQSLQMAHDSCRRWLASDDGRIAVLTRTNNEADAVSAFFTRAGLDHFHVSKQDLFHQLPFRTIWSHLAAVSRPFMPAPWTRLLYQTKTVRTMTESRRITKALRHAAIAFDELIDIDNPTRVEMFAEIMQSDATVVVFDTETTGLDTINDDIVQIAAIKMRRGVIVEGSEFQIFIHSDRPIPLLLGDDAPNPLVDIYSNAEKLPPQQAYDAFFSYAGNDAIVAGHNLNFDLTILQNNVRRHLDATVPAAFRDSGIDTLDVARLLMPHLPNHTLADMIAALGIDGVNSHNATDDARAAALLAQTLLPMAVDKIDEIACRRTELQNISRRLRTAYGSFYGYWRNLYLHPESDSAKSLSNAIVAASNFFTTGGYTDSVQHRNYILRLLEAAVLTPDEPTDFRSQVSAHLFELLSFNEADLYTNGIIDQRLSVMTIHKAKGLEMENVLVYNAGIGFGNRHEESRILYVAFSRARRKLSVGIAGKFPGCLDGVKHMFRQIEP